jgi:hypothetical protein
MTSARQVRKEEDVVAGLVAVHPRSMPFGDIKCGGFTAPQENREPHELREFTPSRTTSIFFDTAQTVRATRPSRQ